MSPAKTACCGKTIHETKKSCRPWTEFCSPFSWCCVEHVPTENNQDCLSKKRDSCRGNPKRVKYYKPRRLSSTHRWTYQMRPDTYLMGPSPCWDETVVPEGGRLLLLSFLLSAFPSSACASVREQASDLPGTCRTAPCDRPSQCWAWRTKYARTINTTK